MTLLDVSASARHGHTPGKTIADLSKKVADVSKTESQKSSELQTAMRREADAAARQAKTERDRAQRQQRDDERRRATERAADQRAAQRMVRDSESRLRDQIGAVIRPPAQEKLRILYATASSRGDLRVDEEIRRVKAAVKAATHRDQVEIEHLPAATAGDVLDGLTSFRPHIVHFSGHANETVLVFDDGSDSHGPGNAITARSFKAAVEAPDQPPTLIVDASEVPRTTDATPRENWMNTNLGVNTEAIFSPIHNKWYISQNRSDGSQAGLMVVTPDGVNGEDPVLNWSSLQWTIDNGLDGHIGVANTADGHGQDVFRMITNITLSPDGTKLYASRNAQLAATNPVLSTTTPGAIVVIPLDASGLPVLNLQGGALTLDSITTSNNTSNASTRPVTLDAAGNVYTGNNIGEKIEVYSPGGNWIATTTSAGGFTLTEVGGGLDGDFNGDDVVDGADFLVWQRGGSPNPLSAGDLDLWKANFGDAAAAPAVGAVPEPATGVLALAAALATSLMASRRRS